MTCYRALKTIEVAKLYTSLASITLPHLLKIPWVAYAWKVALFAKDEMLLRRYYYPIELNPYRIIQSIVNQISLS